MQALPIDAIKNDFVTALSRDHLVVQADTGSGKSTRLPLWAAQNGKVLVIEPRRVACTALAEYVAELAQTQLGHGVGYAIRFEHQYNAQTQILFVTPGVALRWLSENQLSDYSTIIIDEFHERRWDTDLLLALLLKQQKHRLVLTSATIDGERLAKFISGQRLISEGRTFPVEMQHQTQDPRQMPDLRGLEQQVVKTVEQTITSISGDILVFLPGRREITLCQQALSHIDADVIPLHAAVSKATQHKALRQGEGRRIILATNIAETSLTIPGVTVVIDSGLERRTHQRNGRTVLGLHPISLASAQQRAGRAGRTAPGICLRLYGQHAPLENLTPPELLREELTEPLLAAACCGYQLTELSFPNLLPEPALTRAKDKLLAMKAIDTSGEVTDHGRILYPLPLDSLFAHLITAMPSQELTLAMIDLASALSQPQRLFQLPKDEAGLKALKEWQPLGCDALTLIHLLRSQFISDELEVDAQLLGEARTMSNQIRRALSLPKLSKSPAFNREDLLMAAINTVPELAFVRRVKRRQALGNGYSELTVGRESRFSEDIEAAVVFDQHTLPGKGKKQNLSLGTCMAPIKLKQLAAQELGELKMGSASWRNHHILVSVQRLYAGRVIEETESRPSGEMARAAITELILRNTLFKGLAAKLTDDIAAWAIYLALERNKEPAPEVRSWLTHRLAELGVENVEDLTLIEEQDLIFAGIPDWQREDFDHDYPRQLVLANLQLKVEYQPSRKLVIVHKLTGTRRTDPKRWELPKWIGWKIRYQIASRVVDIR